MPSLQQTIRVVSADVGPRGPTVSYMRGKGAPPAWSGRCDTNARIARGWNSPEYTAMRAVADVLRARFTLRYASMRNGLNTRQSKHAASGLTAKEIL